MGDGRRKRGLKCAQKYPRRPAPLHAASPKPLFRATAELQGVVARRVAAVAAQLDRDYPRAEVGQMRDSAEAVRTVIGRDPGPPTP